MKILKNPNHPKLGSSTTVEPIRKLDNIKAISRLLKDKPRDRLLFLVGINNGLRTGDILKLKVYQVQDLMPGDHLRIKESKTGKMNILMINKTVYRALNDFLKSTKPLDDDFLFQSRKGDNRPLLTQSVNHLIKGWTKAINLKGNFGAHTLRKTWGYVQRTVHGVGFEIICKRYNHSSPAVTMRYLGIEDKEVHNILMNEIG